MRETVMVEKCIVIRCRSLLVMLIRENSFLFMSLAQYSWLAPKILHLLNVYYILQ